MAKHIKNLNELQMALMPTIEQMANLVIEDVYKKLNYFLADYYKWEPKSYRRTRDFLYSAVKVEAEPYNGGVRAAVYIDYKKMNHYASVSGYQVAKWANEGTHGGWSVSHKPHVWENTMRHTVEDGSLLRLAAQYLRSQGIHVVDYLTADEK